MKLDERQVAATGVGLIAGLTLGMVALGIHIAGKPTPGPGPSPSPAQTGEFVVVIVDDVKPTVAEGAIIDGPALRSLKANGQAIVRSDQWKRLKDKHYDSLVTQAGGLPMIAVLSKDGHCAYVGKLPMQEAKLQQLLAKYVTGLPPPASEFLTAVTPVSAGAPSQTRTDPGGQPFIDAGGSRRFLASRPGDSKALAKYGDFHPLIPESEWREIDRRPIFGSADWIYDQDGHGSCVGNGGVGALRRVRWLAGMPDVKLSPAALYAQINGGKDQGAVISDIIPALQNTGTCAFALVGQDPIYLRQLPQKWKTEAARFRLGEAYQVDSWEELGSALQTGRYVPVFGVQVGNTWTHFDKFGVAGHDRGPGNHCLHADGLRKTGDGRWVLDTVNSWAYSWGPFQNGRVFLDKNHLFAGGDQPNIVVIRAAQDDPQDDGPPAYKGN